MLSHPARRRSALVFVSHFSRVAAAHLFRWAASRVSMEQEITDFVRAYSKHSVPVQWVGWWSDATDATTKEELYSILFEASTDSLRDLTLPSVRQQVTDMVFHSEHLASMILTEARPSLEKLAETDEESL